MADYLVRAGTGADVETIISHRRAMMQEINRDHALLDSMSHAFRAWLGPRIADGTYRQWFAIAKDDSIAAGVGLWLIDWPPSTRSIAEYRGYLLNVYTEPAHRKQGLARLLTETAIEWCRLNEIDIVMLHASPFGQPLYESIGFAGTNEMRLSLGK